MIPREPRLLTEFGLGRLRPFPGTWGSLPPVVLALALVAFRSPAPLYVAVMLAIALVCSLACLHLGDEAEAHFDRKDPPEVVADEAAGQALALLGVPLASLGPANAAAAAAAPCTAAGLVLVAFVLFRLLDIVKPPPARRAQRVPGGGGILLDDLLAGCYAAALVYLLAWLWQL